MLVAPESQNFDVVVIGGGPGGYATALYGAAAGLNIALVERDTLGGTCLQRGCIPAKEFLETAHVKRTIEAGAEFGLSTSGLSVDFSVSQARKNEVVSTLTTGLTGLLKGRKVTVFSGTAQLQSANQVTILDGADGGTTLSGTNVVLAAGSVPRTIPNFDIDGTTIVTSDET
jgi:dihydrolipoamide dehydrogenase